MSLQAALNEIEPSWYAAQTGDALDAALIARARNSRIGRRLLAHWLATGPAPSMFAPHPAHALGAIAVRWPRELLTALTRDVGVLAFSPAIRAEVGRNAVKRLKQMLGNSYLLALDRTVWEGKVDAGVLHRLSHALSAALALEPEDAAPVYARFERQGRAELRHWATRHDAALAEWVVLTHPRDDAQSFEQLLPPAQVQMLCEHHLSKAERAARQ